MRSITAASAWRRRLEDPDPPAELLLPLGVKFRGNPGLLVVGST
jgi:hypothetical protein